MKRIPGAITLIICLSSIVVGQSQSYIPDASATSGNLNTIPFANGNKRFQYLIMMTDIAPLTTMIVTDLAFAPGASGTFTASQFQIRLQRTSLTMPSINMDINLHAPTIAYDGPISWTAVKDTWCPIKLQYPFYSDGWLNIIVEIRYQGGNGGLPVRDGWTFTQVYGTSYTQRIATNMIPGGPKTKVMWDTRPILLRAADHGHLAKNSPMGIINGTPGDNYQIASSWSQTPPIMLGPYKLYLAMDNLFMLTVLYVGQPFFSYQGVLDVNGAANAYVAVPNIPALIGMRIHHAAVTYDNGGVSAVTNVIAQDFRL